MSGLALGLVLLAACVHASWNLLAKQAHDKLAFLWASALVSAIVYAPLGLWLLVTHPLPAAGWAIVGGSSLLEAAYYWGLAQAYRHGDLSLVYPIARGTAPLLVPILAAVFLGERLSAVGAGGVVLVVGGVLTLHLPALSLRGVRALAGAAGQLGTRYALLTGVFIASYSTLDKRGVALVQPALYAYLLFCGITVTLVPLLLGLRTKVGLEWRQSRRSILLVGLLGPCSYGLVLAALTLAPVSYVSPAREVSVVIAALLGAYVLHEPYGRQRLVGSALIAAGLALLVLG
ncbi:MAG TPA: EamA family transporter [Chloroflexota bacterium]